jgi:predicted Ser/Thr protein kinase
MPDTILSDASAAAGGAIGLGRYHVVRELGRGTAGVVYQADDLVLGQTVALKMVQPAFPMTAAERESFEERFLREARIAARMTHPNVVRVHDFGRDPAGALFIVLEYLEGSPLSEVVSPSAPLLWPEALRIVERVADALQHAHSLGVVHRDVKPANLMLLTTGEVKLLDFGIAKMAEAEGHCTRPGHLLGTPLYMSPEQALGRSVDPRSDVFALGSVLYFLLTGHAPFAAASVPHVLLRVLQDAPVAASLLAPETPEDVDYVVARATTKSPSHRYASTAAMAQDLTDILARRTPRHRAAWRPPRPDDTVPWLALDGDLALADLEAQVLASAANPAAGVSSDVDLSLSTTGGRPVARMTAASWRPAARVFSATALLLVAATFGYVVRQGLELPGAPIAARAPEASARADALRASLPAVAPRTAAFKPPAPPPPAISSGPPTAAAAPAPPVPGTRAAHMAVELEHSLAGGRVRLWVDDTLRLDQALDGRAGGRRSRARS